ncbi:MAG: hypothetical protein JXJ04_25300 [Spirochaetales bacterium]|nr:hypothetical protein [Spirochaetales bacterium]
MKIRYCLSIALLLLIISGCSQIGVEKPGGFADKLMYNEYNAISPEGVLYRVRYVKNYPEKDIMFWQKAVKLHLEKEGYDYLTETEFDAKGKKGILFEWGAPYGHENYIYMTAIIVSGKKIAIAEAAGEFTLYQEYKDELLKSVKTITVR